MRSNKATWANQFVKGHNSIRAANRVETNIFVALSSLTYMGNFLS